MTTLADVTEDGPDALARLAGALSAAPSELRSARSRFVDGERPTGPLVPMSAAKSLVMNLPTDKPVILADESNTSGLGSMPRPLSHWNQKTIAVHLLYMLNCSCC